MGLVTPDFGLIFWMTLSFLIVLFILKKFAWKPILSSLKAREESIEEALESAERAKDKMQEIKADNEKIIAEARKEREKMLQDADDVRKKILSDAKFEASKEANKIIESAKMQIEKEKTNAIKEIKTQVVDISVDIAEKILKKNLSADKTQVDFAADLLKNINLN